jgi:hypothetical protein
MKSHELALGMLAFRLLTAPLLASANTLPVASGSEAIGTLGQTGLVP